MVYIVNVVNGTFDMILYVSCTPVHPVKMSENKLKEHVYMGVHPYSGSWTSV